MGMRAMLKTGAAGLALMLAFGAQAAPEPVAMITDVEGPVLVRLGPGPRSEPADVLMSLPAGAALTLPSGGKLSLVYFGSSKEYQFTGPDAVSLAVEHPTALSGSEAGARSLKALGGARIAPAEVQNLVQAGLQMRSADLRKRIQLRSPVNAVVTEAQPLFVWSPLEPGVQYRFSLHDESGQAILETLIDSTSLRLPEASGLKDGTAYTWTVSARSRSGSDFATSAEFRTADAAQRAAVATLREGLAATASERVLLALMLQNMGLYAEAGEAWQAAARDRPESGQLRRLAAQAGTP